jgi:hypothetical protein
MEVDVSRDVPPAYAKVSVVDVDMPFSSMVAFMIKWAIATIPAMIILFLLGAFLIAVLGGLTR